MLAEYAHPVRPGVWRRYLTIILDGLRPGRATVTPLPEPPLSPAEIGTAMRAMPGARQAHASARVTLNERGGPRHVPKPPGAVMTPMGCVRRPRVRPARCRG